MKLPKEPPYFVNREKELKILKTLLSGRPNLIYFLYGPINSGKTALLTRMFEELSEDYKVFYVNFRARDVEDLEDLLRVLFRGYESEKEEIKRIESFLKKFLKGTAKIMEVISGIPIPEEYFDIIFERGKKADDIFAFLEDYFKSVRSLGFKPVFVLDEIQVIRDVVNAKGKPVLSRLFNFLIRLTKETHLCHVLCATSDCLFVEEVYASARLEGRAKYILVDDLPKKEAFKAYEEFGFEKKELVWDYIGGKFGDIIRLYEEKRAGLSEEEAVGELLKAERGRIEWIKFKKFRKREDREKVLKVLEKFKERGEVAREEVEEALEEVFFWVEENVLFYNPVEGTIRPQGRLIWKVIKEII